MQPNAKYVVYNTEEGEHLYLKPQEIKDQMKVGKIIGHVGVYEGDGPTADYTADDLTPCNINIKIGDQKYSIHVSPKNLKELRRTSCVTFLGFRNTS